MIVEDILDFDIIWYVLNIFKKGSGVVDSSVNDQENPVLVDDFSVVIW